MHLVIVTFFYIESSPCLVRYQQSPRSTPSLTLGRASITSPDLSQPYRGEDKDSSTPHASADVQSHLTADISRGGGEGGGGGKVAEGLAPAADCCIPGEVSGVGEFPPTERPLSSVGGEEGGGVGGPKPPAPPCLRDLEMRQVRETALIIRCVACS